MIEKEYLCAKIGIMKHFIPTLAKHSMRLAVLAALPLLMWSCSDDDDSAAEQLPARTVMVYIAGENSLGSNGSASYSATDLNEMLEGSLNNSFNGHLVVFVDDASSTLPYIAEIKNGVSTVDEGMTFNEDIYSSDPEEMLEILTYIMNNYEAQSYGLVLWGHGSGWLIDNDSIANSLSKRRAYGVDNGSNSSSNSGYWINIPTLSKVLTSLPTKLDFIFADCCQFQCIESAYELRDAANYIIGSPAEIPAEGAPYEVLLPYFFKTSTNYYEKIVDNYNTGSTLSSYGSEEFVTPLSVISTSHLEDFADATAAMLPTLMSADITPSELVYYNSIRVSSGNRVRIMFDARDLMQQCASSSEYYDAWEAALADVVVYGLPSSYWMSNGHVSFSPQTFAVTDDNYGGVSMFIPMDSYDSSTSENPNETIKQMSWYYAIGMDNYE